MSNQNDNGCLTCGVIVALIAFGGVLFTYLFLPTLGIVAACGILLGVSVSTLNFIKAIWEVSRSNYKPWRIKSASIPARETYWLLFGPLKWDVWEIAKETFEKNINACGRTWSKCTQSFSGWQEWWLYCFVRNCALFVLWLLCTITIFLGGFAWIPVLFAVLLVIGLVLSLVVGIVAVVVFLICWLGDWIFNIRTLCKHCSEKMKMPVFICPKCGIEHQKLAPSIRYGLFARRCNCDAKLPTMHWLKIGGKRKSELDYKCPHCSGKISGVKYTPATLAFLGGQSVGKTHFFYGTVAALDDAAYVRKKLASKAAVPPEEALRIQDILFDFKRGNSPGATRSGRIEAVSIDLKTRWRPLYPIRVFLYDPPGEHFTEQAKLHDDKYYRNLQCLVWVIDPFTLSPVRRVFEKNNVDYSGADPGPLEAVETLSRWLNAMKDAFKKLKLSGVNCAVVINKTDFTEFAKLTGLAPGDSDKKCREFLRNHGGGNLLNLFTHTFKNIRFAAVSATGAGGRNRKAAFDPIGLKEVLTGLLGPVVKREQSNIRRRAFIAFLALLLLVSGGVFGANYIKEHVAAWLTQIRNERIEKEAAVAPRIAIEKNGPSEAELGSRIDYTIKVTNVGKNPAKDVVLVNTLPSGLRGNEAQSKAKHMAKSKSKKGSSDLRGNEDQPSFQLGTLAAGESKTVTIPATASAEGTWECKTIVNSSNAATVSAAVSTTIARPAPPTSEQEDLARLAINAENPSVRLDAIEKLTNQALLARIVVDTSDNSVRNNAFIKLTNQGLLADIAKDDKKLDVSETAAGRLTDQEFLADVAKNAKYSRVRWGAVTNYNFTNQEVLTDIVKNDENANVRLAAFKKLTNQTGLESIAKEAEVVMNELQPAVSNGDYQTVRRLLSRSNVNTKGSDNYTALHRAAGASYSGRPQWESTAIVKALLDAGADVNAKNDSGETPLLLAVRVADDPNTKMSTTIGMRPGSRGTTVEVPREYFETRIQIVKMLIAAGADVNAKDGYNGETALHRALSNSCVPVIKALMNAGADVNATTNNGWWSILMAAAGSSSVEIIKDLLAAGADAHYKNYAGLTALHQAAQAAGSYRSGTAGGRGIKELVAAGADVNAQITGKGSGEGQTPLHWAAAGGYIDAVKALLDAGADANIVDAKGNTAYALAVKYGHTEVARMLEKVMGLPPQTIVPLSPGPVVQPAPTQPAVSPPVSVASQPVTTSLPSSVPVTNTPIGSAPTGNSPMPAQPAVTTPVAPLDASAQTQQTSNAPHAPPAPRRSRIVRQTAPQAPPVPAATTSAPNPTPPIPSVRVVTAPQVNTTGFRPAPVTATQQPRPISPAVPAPASMDIAPQPVTKSFPTPIFKAAALNDFAREYDAYVDQYIRLADEAKRTGDMSHLRAYSKEKSNLMYVNYMKALRSASDGDYTTSKEYYEKQRARADAAWSAADKAAAVSTEAPATNVTHNKTEQEVLADLAKNNEDPRVRLDAVGKLTDQAALAYVVKNDKDVYVRTNAFAKLTDQTILADIAQNDKDTYICIAAIGKLDDQATLADIAKNGAKDASVRLAAIGKLTDQAALGYVVKNDKEVYVRTNAFAKLTDQTILADIAQNDKDTYICIAAIGKLDDQATLADIAKNGAKDVSVRLAATGKLTDQAALAYIVKNTKNSNSRAFTVSQAIQMQFEGQIRSAAFAKLTDQAALADIVKNTKDASVRSAAIEKLTDQAILADLAKNEDANVRLAAVKKLTDQPALANIAKNDKNANVCLAAVENLTDQAALADFAKNKNDNFRLTAVKKLTDQAVLAYVSKNDKNANVRLAAVSKLTDQAVLADIAKNDKHPNVRLAAQQRLYQLR